MKGPLEQKSFTLALKVIALAGEIMDKKKEYVLTKQLTRSGTSVGANIREAQHAESKADFVHKLAIAQKECRETDYWLDLLIKSGKAEIQAGSTLKELNNELQKMLASAIITTKSKK